MMRPSEPEGPGAWWQMPQGGIDEGEDPAQAALRELYEETGIRSVEIDRREPALVHLRPAPELALKAWGGRYRGQKQKWFAAALRRRRGRDRRHAAAGASIEFDAWRWADMGELVGLIVPFKRGVYEQVVQDFARARHGRES